MAGSKDDLQPFEFGWFGYFTHSLVGEATGPREMEYAWCKALAHGAAMSLETGKATLDANGRTAEIFAKIKNWEELKLRGYFPERIREQLRQPGREFTLEQAAGGAPGQVAHEHPVHRHPEEERRADHEGGSTRRGRARASRAGSSRGRRPP